jgi:hypothetical protein
MHRVGFEPTMPVFELAKTVHVLDRVGMVIGGEEIYLYILWREQPLLCNDCETGG